MAGATRIKRLGEIQQAVHVSGAGIIADIDTGVDPNHPVRQAVFLSGYEFTRDQPMARK
jgi:hypothetical protein